jgi:hypothetical protein
LNIRFVRWSAARRYPLRVARPRTLLGVGGVCRSRRMGCSSSLVTGNFAGPPVGSVTLDGIGDRCERPRCGKPCEQTFNATTCLTTSACGNSAGSEHRLSLGCCVPRSRPAVAELSIVLCHFCSESLRSLRKDNGKERWRRQEHPAKYPPMCNRTSPAEGAQRRRRGAQHEAFRRAIGRGGVRGCPPPPQIADRAAGTRKGKTPAVACADRGTTSQPAYQHFMMADPHAPAVR